MRKRGRARVYEEATRLVWDSLESHLRFLGGPQEAFHLAAVKDYLRILELLNELYS